jgi:octaprenyl-diphosphate synthase
MDISWHRDFASLPSVEEYTLMCRLKTGVLARLAAELGVICAAALTGAALPGDSPSGLPLIKPKGEPSNSLGEAAEKLGVGFQILDDVKNLRTGNPGKKRGDDVVEGKKSLPVLLYLHGPGAENAALVERCFTAARAGGTGVPEVEELIRTLENSGTLEDAKRRGLALIREARECFAALGTEAGGKLLAGLIDSLAVE